MSSRIEHHAEFPHPLDQVLSALSSEESLLDQLEQIGGHDAKLLSHEPTDTGVSYRLQQGIPSDKLPSAMRTLHSGDLMVNREQTWRRVDDGRVIGDSIASVGGVPGEIKAKTELTATASGTSFKVSGEVKVRIPLIGGKIERVIAENVVRLLKHECTFHAERLAPSGPDPLPLGARCIHLAPPVPRRSGDLRDLLLVDRTERRYVITFGCPDRTGIVARIASFIADAGGWIVEAAYHTDTDTGWFFTRQEVRADSLPFGVDELRERFAPVAASLGAESEHSPAANGSHWRIDDTGVHRRVVLLVSKEGHCLYDLLGRVASGELDIDVRAVIGNHDSLAAITRAHGIPFHLVPFPREPEGKAAAFKQVAEIVDSHDPHAIVLARFMQILPEELCTAWSGRALNIHHSFLPSFMGARPYHQAYTRGVKLVGATCHYVTAELDAGPIIEQDVIRVDHGDTISDMVRKGRDIEKVVLSRGLRWHLENRVLVHAGRTVVF